MSNPCEKPRTLKTIILSRDWKEETKGLDFPDRTHAKRMIDGDRLVLTPDGILALMLKAIIEPSMCDAAKTVSEHVHGRLDLRAAALGSKSMPRIKEDGTLGYTATPDSVVGISERDDVREGLFGTVHGKPPHVSPLTRDRNDLLLQLRPIIERMSELFDRYLPTPYEFQRRAVKSAPREFRLWQTPFSSAYIPVHLRSGYHFDGSNLRGGMSVLAPLGDFVGGELILCRWRVGFALETGDLLIFNGFERHGNLPILEGDRASLISYCVKGLPSRT